MVPLSTNIGNRLLDQAKANLFRDETHRRLVASLKGLLYVNPGALFQYAVPTGRLPIANCQLPIAHCLLRTTVHQCTYVSAKKAPTWDAL